MKLEWEFPEHSEAWPCPEACGGLTEDPYGGPCKACWRVITARERTEGEAG
jgi:hypothetical protein